MRRVEEIPNTPESFVLYLVGQNQFLWNASMICPCGCGELLQMGLMPEGRPQWFAQFHRDGKISFPINLENCWMQKSLFLFKEQD